MRVFCVLKSGGAYTPEHVYRLQAQVYEQHPDATFVCWSDLMDLECPNLPLIHDLPGWWSKLEMFREGVPEEATIYLDLDVDVVGPLTPLLSDSFTMCSDFIQPQNVNSSVMAWIKPPYFVLNEFLYSTEANIQRYRRWPRLGDQAYIEDQCDHIRRFPAGTVVSYRLQCQEGVPEGASVVAYHGKPKPWELENG